ncbi:hypothetical protein IJ182_08960 [bacterium]|nr:hypothetical protein [bacterium]
MSFNRIFKLFALALFLFFASVLVSLAETLYQNTISQVVIEEGTDNNFKLNLVFDEKYTGNAFIQKRENGSFYVYIPDTSANKKGVKVLYRNSKDKGIIKLSIEESVYQRQNQDSNYIKLYVDVIGSHSIQLYSKTVEEQALEPPIHSFDKYDIAMICLLVLAGLFIWKLLSVAKRNGYNFKNKPNKYISNISSIMSRNNLVNNNINTETQYTTSSEPQQGMSIPMANDNLIDDSHVLPKVNMKKSMKSSEGEAFSCFDIPFVNEAEYTSPAMEIKKQLDALKMDKLSKTTNPISNRKETESEFSLPMVEEIVQKKQEQPKEIKKNEPELLSELRITPRKGFYLTATDDNTFALFGFVDSNVFLLKRFNDLSQINLQARFYDRQQKGDLYIVRLDSYKAMIEISDNGMRELAVL